MDIITVTMHGDRDYSALQMVSGRRLAHLHRIEALATELVRELNQAVAPVAESCTIEDRGHQCKQGLTDGC